MKQSRIDYIKAAIKAGTFKPDAQAIAAALIKGKVL